MIQVKYHKGITVYLMDEQEWEFGYGREKNRIAVSGTDVPSDRKSASGTVREKRA